MKIHELVQRYFRTHTQTYLKYVSASLSFHMQIRKHAKITVFYSLISSGQGHVCQCGKVKVKFFLCLIKHHAMKTYWRSGGIAPRILDLGTR
jgi:hypothetical protein